MQTATPEPESQPSSEESESAEQRQADIELPHRWEVIEGNDQIPLADQHDAVPSIIITHVGADYTAELYLRTAALFSKHIDNPTAELNGLNKWDITYVDPDGVPRDGLTQFYHDPQTALDEFVAFIREDRTGPPV